MHAGQGQAQAGVARLRARRRRQGAPRCKKTRVRLGSYLGVRRELEAHLGCFGITKHSLLHALSVLYPHSIVQKSPYHPLASHVSRAPLSSPLPPQMPTMSGTLDSSLAEVLEHVEDAHVLRLLPQHVLVYKVVLQCQLLQEDLQPPPQWSITARSFCTSRSVSCTHPVVSEQQQQLAKTASHFLIMLCSSMCRWICPAGAA